MEKYINTYYFRYNYIIGYNYTNGNNNTNHEGIMAIKEIK